MMSESVENWWRRFEWCVRNAKKAGVIISLKKMKCQCNRWVLVRNPDTPKEIVQFVHEVRPVLAVTLSTLLHMLCGWNDDTMPNCNLLRVHFKCFWISGSYSSKKISKCMKNNKWSQKVLKIDDVALNDAYWTHKKPGVEICLKNEMSL